MKHMTRVPQDTPEDWRNHRQPLYMAINSKPLDKAGLEALHGQVWDQEQFAKEFILHRFIKPYVQVTQVHDKARGYLKYQESPLLFFDFELDPLHQYKFIDDPANVDGEDKFIAGADTANAANAATAAMAVRLQRIYRDRRLTDQEVAKDDQVREQIAQELPELLERHHARQEADQPLNNTEAELLAALELVVSMGAVWRVDPDKSPHTMQLVFDTAQAAINKVKGKTNDPPSTT